MMNVFWVCQIGAILDSFLNRLLKLLKNLLAIERTENSLEIVLLVFPEWFLVKCIYW